jgi:8-oxo-dGTP pyrophosphatase MutT (NUDIX family)
MSDIVARIIEVCVFRFDRSDVEYLLLRRAPDEPAFPGLWQIVTGSVEEGEKAIDAALRELREETGVRPGHFWVVPFTNSFYDHRRDCVNLIPFFAAQFTPGESPRLSDEHSEFAWLSYSDARTRLVWPGQRAGLDVVHSSIVSGGASASLTDVPL